MAKLQKKIYLVVLLPPFLFCVLNIFGYFCFFLIYLYWYHIFISVFMQESDSNRLLKIYKASAGSGKTFTLAVEYIKLLIVRPDNYRHILAVTFTNKATAEMKQRILSQLYGIGYALPDSDDYVAAIRSAPELKEVFLTHGAIGEEKEKLFIQKQCRRALSLMMHDYSRFRIETIDSFFQSIIRELAHELGLTANLRVDLNSDEVLAEAVQALIESLVRKDTDKQAAELFRSLFSFIQERIDENVNWDVVSDVIAFGKNIFNEQYLAHSLQSRTAISHPDILRAYGSLLRSLSKELHDHLRTLGESFLTTAAQAGVTRDDLAKTSSPFDYFGTLAGGNFPKPMSNTLKARLTDSNKWVTKAGARWLPLVESTLRPMLQSTAAEVAQYRKQDNTASAIRRHIYHLSLIHVIDTMVRRLNEEANRFLLADTGHFLNALIAESDVPFIYERTGTAFHYIMIDEFQDTSMLQWKNFIPLIKNCLDGGNRCLIVGDVKQSIYRWRNSDWGILNDLRPDTPGDFRYFIDDSMSLKNTNYRSDGNVVTFNNMFFESAAEQLCRLYLEKTQTEDDVTDSAGTTSESNRYVEDIRKAYAGLAQDFRSKKLGCGFVRVECLTKPDKKSKDPSDDDTKSLEQRELERIVQAVRMLTDRGVAPADISILVRANRLTTLIMNHFASLPDDTFPAIGHRIQIVSDDAFRLDSSPAVCCIVQALRLILNPGSRMERILLAYRYQTDICQDEELIRQPGQLFLADDERLLSFLPHAFAERLDELVLMPLFRLVQHLVEVLDIERIEGQSSYLFSFFDRLTDYLSNKTGDIEDFLAFWDESLAGATIPVGSLEGIHITSIHKSKGLEFKSVIVPFCDWALDGKSTNLLWCTTEGKPEPFDVLPLVPVRYDAYTKDSEFKNEYQYETLKNYVDNLNMIYVAFTRAKNNLIVIAGERDNRYVDQLIRSALFDNIYEGKPDEQGHKPYAQFGERTTTEDGTMQIFQVGTIQPDRVTTHEASLNVLEQVAQPTRARFHQHQPELSFLQSNRSADFIESTAAATDEQTDASTQDKDRYLNEGRIFHALMASVHRPSDVDTAIARLDMEGLFPDTFYRDHVAALVKKAFRDPRAAEWFDPHWRVINECDILYRDENGTLRNKRPDRVLTDGTRTLVIDYKTGRQDESHVQQVDSYMQLLRDMGYPHVEGYLWYIRREEIVRVP